MKNIRSILKKYPIYIVSIVIIFFIANYPKYDTPEDYFWSNYKNVTEILYRDSFSKNHYIIFFLENDGYISCALLKKDWTGYRLIRTSGKLSLSQTGYLCSFFQDNNEDLWINWNIITDNKIKSIWTEYGKMKIIECQPYSYRICWMIGKGKGPENHIEKTS